jgi:hypothetical protein
MTLNKTWCASRLKRGAHRNSSKAGREYLFAHVRRELLCKLLSPQQQSFSALVHPFSSQAGGQVSRADFVDMLGASTSFRGRVRPKWRSILVIKVPGGKVLPWRGSA